MEAEIHQGLQRMSREELERTLLNVWSRSPGTIRQYIGAETAQASYEDFDSRGW